ncbi:hypothetical protein SY83_21815 [Paenibacillus swuensis]|uniref:Phosphoribosylglycinamide formyltransferase n=1 Tax=Paenibacillus swuensis TaxID=1178515 RepID=A0A172TN52_9BACL|nr:MmcQ/YjbR family DNA-binding protein [Paenibacillus swuensis]ANE48481.1 hypothetical protein SY83_21815 [Paenibacillus swuensis]
METERLITTDKGLRLLARIRTICMALPETEEKIDGFGHTSFRVQDKPYVMMGQTGDVANLHLKTDKETQSLLLAREDDAYRMTPYIGRHGWVTAVHADPDADAAVWYELTELITEAYLRTAPKRLRNSFLRS